MTWVMMPAVVGMCIKLWVLIAVKQSTWMNGALIGFVSVTVVQNLNELLLFHAFNLNWDTNFLIRSYYLCTIWAMVYGFYYLMDLSKYPLVKYVAIVILIAAISLTMLLLFTDIVVAGSIRLSYVATAIKGSNYWTYQLFTLVTISGWIGCLILNYRNAVKPKDEVRHFYTLIGLAPLALVSLILLVLIGAGWPLNATIILPLASTLFLLVTIRGMSLHDKHQDIRSLLPFSLENLIFNKINKANTQYAFENMSHKELMTTIERAAIEYKLRKNNGNVSKTAKSMKVERSTLYNKFKVLNIDITNFKDNT